MKKLILIPLLLLLCSCDVVLREDYYVFSFDDFTIAPGYDNVDFMRLVFDVRNSKYTLESKEEEKRGISLKAVKILSAAAAAATFSTSPFTS